MYFRNVEANATVLLSHNNWMSEDFWSYLAIRVLLDVLRASSLMLFEGAVVSIIKQHGGDYGLQKLFGTFGAVIFGPLSGVLIDFGQGYSGVIVLYSVIRAATALCILKLDLDFKVSSCQRCLSSSNTCLSFVSSQNVLFTSQHFLKKFLNLRTMYKSCTKEIFFVLWRENRLSSYLEKSLSTKAFCFSPKAKKFWQI